MTEGASGSTRSRLRLGSCPDSWGVWFADDPRQTPWHRFLDELAEAGYRWLELGPYGYLPTDPARLREEVDRRGLQVSGQAVFGALHDRDRWDADLRDARQVAELVTWCCSRRGSATWTAAGWGRESSTSRAGGPWSTGPRSWAGSSARNTASPPCSIPTPTATSGPSRRSSGSSRRPTRPASACAWTPATSPTTEATASTCSAGTPTGSATCT